MRCAKYVIMIAVRCCAGARPRRLTSARYAARWNAVGWARVLRVRRALGASGSTSLHPSLGAASATTSATAAADPIGIAGSERGTIGGVWSLGRLPQSTVTRFSSTASRNRPVRPAPRRGWGKQARLISTLTSLCKHNTH